MESRVDETFSLCYGGMLYLNRQAGHQTFLAPWPRGGGKLMPQPDRLSAGSIVMEYHFPKTPVRQGVF